MNERTHVEIDPDLRIPIPMIGGGRAMLSIPRMVSHGNFVYLKSILVRLLDEMEEAITIEPEEPQELVDLGEKIRRLEQQNVELSGDFDRVNREVNMHRSHSIGEYWAWQGGVEDHLESLSCPVLIPAAELRKLKARLDHYHEMNPSEAAWVYPEPEVAVHPDLGPPAGPPEIEPPNGCNHEIQMPDNRCVKCGMTRAAIEDQIPF